MCVQRALGIECPVSTPVTPVTPKNIVQLKGWATSDVDLTTLESCSREYISVSGYDRVLRTVCSKNMGEVIYRQDEYPDGRLVTCITTKNVSGIEKTVTIKEKL